MNVETLLVASLALSMTTAALAVCTLVVSVRPGAIAAHFTKAGHIYVLTNPESFGDAVCKIGAAAGRDPQRIIASLNNSAVPFDFTLDALIPCNDINKLRRQLHHLFRDRAVNPRRGARGFYRLQAREVIEQAERLGYPAAARGQEATAPPAQGSPGRRSLERRGSPRRRTD